MEKGAPPCDCGFRAFRPVESELEAAESMARHLKQLVCEPDIPARACSGLSRAAGMLEKLVAKLRPPPVVGDLGPHEPHPLAERLRKLEKGDGNYKPPGEFACALADAAAELDRLLRWHTWFKGEHAKLIELETKIVQIATILHGTEVELNLKCEERRRHGVIRAGKVREPESLADPICIHAWEYDPRARIYRCAGVGCDATLTMMEAATMGLKR
jgi:hypothetical protein